MISPDALNAWRTSHPWADDDQIEQDLIMTRVAVEIALQPELRDRLAWRGGTCLHKLFLPVALRYSEDLDYVAYDLSIEDNDMRTLRAGLRDVAERTGDIRAWFDGRLAGRTKVGRCGDGRPRGAHRPRRALLPARSRRRHPCKK